MCAAGMVIVTVLAVGFCLGIVKGPVVHVRGSSRGELCDEAVVSSVVRVYDHCGEMKITRPRARCPGRVLVFRWVWVRRLGGRTGWRCFG